MNYEKFSEALEKRVQKKKRKDRLIAYLLFEGIWELIPALGTLGGNILLQVFWGQYNFVKIIWIFTAIVIIANVWYFIDAIRAELEEDE